MRVIVDPVLFLKLPPVVVDRHLAFAFESSAWEKSVEKCFRLRKVFRQCDQGAMAPDVFLFSFGVLNIGRICCCTGRDSHGQTERIDSGDNDCALAATGYPRWPRTCPIVRIPVLYAAQTVSAERATDRIVILCSRPLALPADRFPLKSMAKDANDERLSTLPDKLMHMYAIDKNMPTDATVCSKMLRSCPAEDKLSFKRGAQVMLVQNLSTTLVNGTIGTIVDFVPRSKTRRGSLYPLVRFTVRSGLDNGWKLQDHLVTPHTWSWEDLAVDGAKPSRRQVPLILAWGISIHKSQGQSIDWVQVDLDGTFECGTARAQGSTCRQLKSLHLF